MTPAGRDALLCGRPRGAPDGPVLSQIAKVPGKGTYGHGDTAQISQRLWPPSIGHVIAQDTSTMAARKMLDRQPGMTPEVRRNGDEVTFTLDVAGAPEHVKLVVRCTLHGIFASVTNLPAQGTPDQP
jgi:hypothetical protein